MTAGLAVFRPAPREGRLEHYLPNEVQRLALLAALGPADTAQRDLSRWEQTVDLDTGLDSGTFRLLPLLAERIEALGLECAHAGRFSGTAKVAWVQNERLFFSTRGGLETLVGAGMTVTLLKGAAFSALRGSRARRNRPMADLDLLVDADEGPEAFRLLSERGWRHVHWETARPKGPPTYRRWCHGVDLELPGTPGRLDLHWRHLYYPPPSRWDAWLRDGATVTSLMGIPVQVPAPDRLLVHAIAHGARPSVESPIRWVVDAHQLIANYPSSIDWDAVTAIAADIHMPQRFGACLGWLRRHLDSPVPPAVLNALAARASVLERVEIANERKPLPRSLIRQTVHFACELIQCQPEPAWTDALGTRPHFVRDRLGVNRARQVPGAVLRRFSEIGLRPLV